MKKYFLVICAALALTACSGDKAGRTAESFLSSYLEMDYENAVAYCDSTVAASLRTASANWQDLDSTLLNMIKEAAAATRYEITAVDDESQKDKALVSYTLYPMGSDQGQEMKMTLTKKSGKWLVSALE